MKSLRHEDHIELIGCIHDVVLDVDLADDAIGRMADILEADRGVLVRLKEDRRRDIVLGQTGFDRGLINRILSQRENPESFLAQNVHWQSGRVTSDTDCKQSNSKWKKTETYRDLFVPNGIEHTLLGVVDSRELHNVLLWFHRDAKQSPFAAKEKRFFEKLMPQWQRAIRHKLAYDFRHSALTSAGLILDESPFGLFLLSRDGHILYSNEVAKSMCAAEAGVRIRARKLQFSDRDIRDAYENMQAATRHSGRENDPRLAPISIPKTNGSGAGSFQLGVRKLQMPPLRGSLAPRSVTAVFLYDTDVRMELSTDSLKSLYDLTDAEARVCELLYKSGNLQDVARALDVSINTAKTHLTRSFRKVGVQSQTELVRRLHSQLYIN